MDKIRNLKCFGTWRKAKCNVNDDMLHRSKSLAAEVKSKGKAEFDIHSFTYNDMIDHKNRI